MAIVAVAITTDLQGYAAFWNEWMFAIACVGFLAWAVIVSLLFAIWRKR